MSSVRSIRSRFAVRFGILMSAVLVLAACSKKDEGSMEGEAEDQVKYNLGAAVEDSAIAAIVTSQFGSDTLKTADFRTRYAGVLQQFPMIQGNAEQSTELKRTIVEDFIMEHLISGEVKRGNFTPDTAKINEQLRAVKGQFPSQEVYQQFLQQRNLTEDSLRSNIVEFLRRQMYQERIEAGITKPSAAELEAFRKEQSEEVRAQHILFLTQGMDQQQQDSVKARAQVVLDSVRKGTEPFEELAKRHSQDPGSAQVGGDLNYFSRGAMVPEFEEATFALKDSGAVAPDLVRTQFGYHIIRLTGRRQGELIDTSRANQALMGKRKGEAIEAEINRLKKLATVRVNEQVVEVDINAPRDDS